MVLAGAERLSLSTFSGTRLVKPKSCLIFPRARTSIVRVNAFKVTLKLPEGETKEYEVSEDEYILDAAEGAGIDLPYSCRSGTCSTCAAKVLEGELDQTDQTYLDEAAIEKGYALICVGYAKSDLVLETHKEEEAMAI